MFFKTIVIRLHQIHKRTYNDIHCPCGLLFNKKHDLIPNPEPQVVKDSIRKHIPDCNILKRIFRSLRVLRMKRTVELYQVFLIPEERREYAVFHRIFCKCFLFLRCFLFWFFLHCFTLHNITSVPASACLTGSLCLLWFYYTEKFPTIQDIKKEASGSTSQILPSFLTSVYAPYPPQLPSAVWAFRSASRSLPASTAVFSKRIPCHFSF